MNPEYQKQLTLSDLAEQVLDRRVHSVSTESKDWTVVLASANTPEVFRNIINGTKGKFILGTHAISFELPQDATAFKLLQGGEMW